jgi:hypothetical protein
MPPEQITTAQLDARLGSDAAEISRLFALADEAKYSGYGAGATDFSRWLQLVRRQLTQHPSP